MPHTAISPEATVLAVCFGMSVPDMASLPGNHKNKSQHRIIFITSG